MNDVRDDGLDRLEVLLALQSLLDFAKLSAEQIEEQALSKALSDAKSIARHSIEELHE